MVHARPQVSRKPFGSVLKNITTTTLLVLVGAAAQAGAHELCASWPRRIEPDMQVEEAAFTREAYDAAKLLLERLAKGEIESPHWTLEPNARTIVTGYELRSRALAAAAKTEPPGVPSEQPEVQAFCRFLVERAFVSD